MHLSATTEQINELRNAFNRKFEEIQAGKPDPFHPADLERVKNNDHWVGRFLEHVEGQVPEALNMLVDTLEWRQSYGTNDINETNIRMEYLIDGMFFTHSQDKDGCRLFIFKNKKHQKGLKDFEELKKCVVYWFERIEREEQFQKKITLFFDMADTGISNMDMEFTKYLIGLFKQYYPTFLNYILIFEMPWVMNAAFKVIKSWLPAKAVEKIKFVNKKTLGEYVPPEHALKCWGGTDEYVFTFIPEDVTTFKDAGGSGDKKVHFLEGSDEGLNPDAVLSVSPADVIVFTKDGGDLHGSFTITNRGKRCVSYKVKTTSPEKFRVRPTNGLLNEGDSLIVNVILLPGFQIGGLSRDKFMIMSMLVEKDNMTPNELTELWKNNSNKQVEQHRLRCTEQTNSIITRNGLTSTANTSSNPVEITASQLNSLITSVKKIQDQQAHLQRSVKRTELIQLLNLVLIITITTVFAYLFRHELSSGEMGSCYRN